MATVENNPDTISTKVLIVDDRPKNIFAMEKILESLNIDLFTAQSGNEALTHMLHNDFAVALLDVQMPGMDGFELASLMRENEMTAHIPIIFVTAISKEDRYMYKGYGSGAVDYLVKPIDPDVVKSKVRVFCELYDQRKELEREIETRKRVQKENEALIAEITQALEQIKTLRGIIPICAKCKSIRDDKGYWHQLEAYIDAHSEAEFSHSLCENCVRELYPEVADAILNETKDNNPVQ